MSEALAVKLLHEEVRRRLSPQGNWPVERMAELLAAEINQNPRRLMALTVAAVLELSRNQNSTGAPITSGTCESICENGGPGEPPPAAIPKVAKALHRALHPTTYWMDISDARKRRFEEAARIALASLPAPRK